ncbi:MAG: M4 family metallopeptidase [Thermoanaerobaculia bacterium]
MRKTALMFVSAAFVLALAAGPSAALGSPPEGKGDGKSKVLDPAGIERLQRSTGNNARVTVSRATGAVRFVSLTPGVTGDLMSSNTQSARQKSSAFLNEYASIFGLRNADAEMRLSREMTDRNGGKHLTYTQVYQEVPVFAGALKAHFNKHGELTAVNGDVVPEINLDPRPSRSLSEAAATALARVGEDKGEGKSLAVQSTQLLIYRTGLAQGVEGQNHLTWQVEVGNGGDVREFVYVDAHTGKVVDQLTGIFDALNRRAYDGQFSLLATPPNYPGTPFWVEGQLPFPTLNTEADNMIFASKETYDLFDKAFGRDSFDDLGATMDAIFNRGNACPNASWNGTFISFCNGLTTDDVTGHEWTHAYTQYTHGLIYAWQPGALNESYSDIYGETVDLINLRMTDTPNTLRTAGLCSTFQVLAPITRVTAPPSIAADYPSGTSSFSPGIVAPGTSGQVLRPNDGVVDVAGTTLTDGCGPAPSFLAAPNSWTNAAQVLGKIVLIDRGVCGFAVKALNAQRNGAIGVIIANVVTTQSVPPNMGGASPAEPITIPVTSMNFANGQLLRGQLGVLATVNATLTEAPPPPAEDNSVRWLLGEDDTATGLFGPLRDMWTPTCFGNPGKVTDSQYSCSTGDNGGVHNNSGVPNHAYALIVDGGTYNSQTISGIGLTKAAHIYFRAMTVYQGPASDFVDHADAIEQSATDLIGVNLADLLTGAPSGEIITAADVDEIEKAMLAVEMRTLPTFCNFQPMLAQTPPDRCTAGLTQVALFSDDFESGSDGWTVSHDAVTRRDFTDRDWELDGSLPGDPARAGTAFFGIDPGFGTCAPGGDESGVLHLTSPLIRLPGNAANPRLTFDHYVATEAGFDGGNLKIRVNGGAYTLVAAADYTFNPYNTTLITAAGGNTNPLAGQRAFSGSDGGSVEGTWGRSHVNLSNYAGPNDKISLRWDFGTDGCGGIDGWYVDDVTVYACLPTISINDVTVAEGNSGKKSVTFTVSLSPASPSPVTVKYKSADGTALSGANDYVPTGLKTLTIPALATSATFTVDVKGDTLIEPNEVFFVNLSAPTNATIIDGQGQCTITNDDI